MATHVLKTWPVEFSFVLTGLKTFDIRKDDGRGFRNGDELHLCEYDPDEKRMTGRSLRALVTCMVVGPTWGVPEGMVVMSLKLLPALPEKEEEKGKKKP